MPHTQSPEQQHLGYAGLLRPMDSTPGAYYGPGTCSTLVTELRVKIEQHIWGVEKGVRISIQS